MNDPGYEWDRMCPRSPSELVLTLDGRRSIFAWWPPTAVCEKCGVTAEILGSTGGYVGPVEGDTAYYPNADFHFVCRSCARALVGLADDELTGHTCGQCDSDTLHVDRGYHPRGAMEGKDEAERIAYVTTTHGYTERGWTVVSVQPAPDMRPAGGTPWAVYFRATRSLP